MNTATKYAFNIAQNLDLTKQNEFDFWIQHNKPPKKLLLFVLYPEKSLKTQTSVII